MWLTTLVTLGVPLKIWNNTRLEMRLKEQEGLAVRARLDALTQQINPHFLFNTLNSISAATRSDPTMARNLIQKLSTILRRVLDKQKNFVPLAEELEYIDSYLDIEVARFGTEKLRVVEEIEPEALTALVPCMVLQPLVENAVLHAIAPSPSGGTLFVRARCEQGVVHIEIADDGRGFDPSQWNSTAQPPTRSAACGAGARHRPRQRAPALADGVRSGPGDRRGTRSWHPDPVPRSLRTEPRPAAGSPGECRMTIRTVFADDEKLAREEIGYLLQQVSDVQVVGAAENGVDAVQMIERERPDLVLLDIEMPGLDGFQVVREMRSIDNPPRVIFVTAYDRYALQAFEVSALDYLMKPVSATGWRRRSTRCAPRSIHRRI